jgi:hypothetical protein
VVKTPKTKKNTQLKTVPKRSGKKRPQKQWKTQLINPFKTQTQTPQ